MDAFIIALFVGFMFCLCVVIFCLYKLDSKRDAEASDEWDKIAAEHGLSMTWSELKRFVDEYRKK